MPADAFSAPTKSVPVAEALEKVTGRLTVVRPGGRLSEHRYVVWPSTAPLVQDDTAPAVVLVGAAVLEAPPSTAKTDVMVAALLPELRNWICAALPEARPVAGWAKALTLPTVCPTTTLSHSL